MLDDALAEQAAAVSSALETAASQPDGPVQLMYYRDQAQFDAYGSEPGKPYGQANANARAIADALRSQGMEVTFAYPDDPDC